MRLNILPNVDFKTKTVTAKLGDGINTFLTPFEIGESEWTYGRNCSSKKYPALAVRPGRKYTFGTLTSGNIIGQRNNQYPHVLDLTTWYRWDGSAWQSVQVLSVGTSGKFIDFKTGTTLYTIMVNETDKYAWDGTTVTSLTQMPTTKLAAVHKGRVYALSGKTLYFSALNLINDWTTANDSGQIILTNAKGDGTGLVEYGNHIIAFTEFSMHELYGSGPSSYTLQEVEGAKGCISDNSIIEWNGVLYYAHYDGIYAYTGGRPVKISDKMNAYFSGLNLPYKNIITSWGNGYSVYFSIAYGDTASGNNITLEYDTKWQKWYVHSYGISDATNIGGKAYGLNENGTRIWDMENGTDDAGTAIAWEVIGKVNNDGAISQKKVVSNLWIVYDMPIGSACDVYVSPSVDDNDFTKVTSLIASATEQMQRAILPITLLQNINWYRIRFVGSGPCTIYYLEKDLRIKAR